MGDGSEDGLVSFKFGSGSTLNQIGSRQIKYHELYIKSKIQNYEEHELATFHFKSIKSYK